MAPRDGNLEAFILRTVERWWAGRYSERHALVTSYDPDTYLAQVKFMPDGPLSGWLPIETGHIGNGYGIAVGLVPGSGDPNDEPSKSGDQVVVRFQEGDFETGKIVQRVHSDDDKPPKVKQGEMVLWTVWGQKIFFANDGSLTLQTGQIAPGDHGKQLDTLDEEDRKKPKHTTIRMDIKGTITTTVDTDEIDNVGRDVTRTIAHDLTDTIKHDYTINVKPDPGKPAGVFTINVALDFLINVGNDYLTVIGNEIKRTAMSDITDTSFTQIELTAPVDILNALCKLGGIDANRPASALGTLDTSGFIDVSNLATRVLVK